MVGEFPSVIIEEPLIEGIFLTRPNRFLAIVQVRDEELAVHVPDPGRLKELLIPGRRVYLQSKEGKSRKTRYDLILVDLDGILVSINSILPNYIVADALKRGFFPELKGYPIIQRESIYGNSRLDFRLTGGDSEDSFVEVKSVSLVRNGLALFPDAPTSRGVRHLHELLDIRSKGLGAWVIFIIQREDALEFSPNKEMDPKFAEALNEALYGGVKALACKCQVTLEGVHLIERVPIKL